MPSPLHAADTCLCHRWYMNAELLVSVSGVRDLTRDAAIGFAEEMDQRGVRLSLLVAPRLKAKYRLADDPTTQTWLRGRRNRGDAIVLHGYDQAATKRRRAEFATLPRHEALLRLTAADRAMEQVGLRTRLFAAPRWDASSGAMAALPELGFRLSVGLTGIHDLERNSLQKSWVYGIGEGFRAEPWWCRALVLGAARTARRGGILRLAVSAAQLGRPGPRQAMLDAVDLALYHGAHSEVYRWEQVRAVRAA
jgi:predicted deacetylase